MNPKTDSKQAVRTASTLPVISGLRLTKQRQEVYQVLLEQRDHPTANEVYQRVRKKLPSISLATVYNCLEALVNHGLVNQVNEERTPRTVADVKEMLTKHSNGEIQRTIQNCITILQNDHVLADAIRLNLLSERIDIVKPVGWPRSGKTLNDTDMKYILRRMEKYGISSEKKIESAIRIVAYSDPTALFLESYPNAGKSLPLQRLRLCAGTARPAGHMGAFRALRRQRLAAI